MEPECPQKLGVGPGVPTLPGVGLGGTLPEVSVVATVLGLRVLPSPVGPAVLGVEPRMEPECLQKYWVWDGGANLARGGSGWNTSRGLRCGDCARAQSAAFPCGSSRAGVEPTDGTGVPSEVLGVGRGCQPARGGSGWNTSRGLRCGDCARAQSAAFCGPAVLGVEPTDGTGVPQKYWVWDRGCQPCQGWVWWNTSRGLRCGDCVLGLRVLPSPVGPAVLGVEPTDGTGVPSEVLGVGPGVPTLPGVGLGWNTSRGLRCGDCARAQSAAFPCGSSRAWS
ncbi:expressed unknown protein [Seminavis robusta]|uniref:Uncharacterized protein n=1 Tax=Seminavis robusta TaxID=568900 RepID=A0A9N8D5E1_9STRA|nr:expressed unknown protein [Seminavis robusta]|eukprot:Sro8_g006940.1 n/a (279) ;mRNA; r:252126-252962